MHGRQRSIPLHARLDPHLDRMSPSMNQEHLLTGAGDLDRPSCAARKLTGTDLMREGVGLAPKTAADAGGNDTDVGHR